MTTKEHLLVVAAEECAEIQQALTKILRFGIHAHHPSDPEMTNGEQVLTEYYQLQAVFNMLFENGVLKPFAESIIASLQQTKQEKVTRYMTISRHLGRMTDADPGIVLWRRNHGHPRED